MPPAAGSSDGGVRTSESHLVYEGAGLEAHIGAVEELQDLVVLQLKAVKVGAGTEKVCTAAWQAFARIGTPILARMVGMPVLLVPESLRDGVTNIMRSRLRLRAQSVLRLVDELWESPALSGGGADGELGQDFRPGFISSLVDSVGSVADFEAAV